MTRSLCHPLMHADANGCHCMCVCVRERERTTEESIERDRKKWGQTRCHYPPHCSSLFATAFSSSAAAAAAFCSFLFFLSSSMACRPVLASWCSLDSFLEPMEKDTARPTAEKAA